MLWTAPRRAGLSLVWCRSPRHLGRHRFSSVIQHRRPGSHMHFERLTKAESTIVKEALLAAAGGPFFPDWEFQTLFGLTREQVRRVASEWPLPNLPPDDVVLAVNNSLNWLLSYPHRMHDQWSDWIWSISGRSMSFTISFGRSPTKLRSRRMM